jgi:hypothetical protein
MTQHLRFSDFMKSNFSLDIQEHLVHTQTTGAWVQARNILVWKSR